MTTPTAHPRLPRRVHDQLFAQGAAAATGDRAARAIIASAPRTPNPVPHNTTSPTLADAANSWDRGYWSVDPPNFEAIDDAPPQQFPRYTYPLPR